MAGVNLEDLEKGVDLLARGELAERAARAEGLQMAKLAVLEERAATVAMAALKEGAEQKEEEGLAKGLELLAMAVDLEQEEVLATKVVKELAQEGEVVAAGLRLELLATMECLHLEITPLVSLACLEVTEEYMEHQLP